jgi:hypothetical protein
MLATAKHEKITASIILTLEHEWQWKKLSPAAKTGVPREKASRCEERSKNHHSRPKTILRQIIRERDFPASVDKVKIMSIVRNSIDLAGIISDFATFLINPAKFACRPPGPLLASTFPTRAGKLSAHPFCLLRRQDARSAPSESAFALQKERTDRV